ncbi:hypothetical protein BDN71DRAFT_546782 [Pleurotus eryngii]|uniref:Uncharacterized protein n=1 Tax=Pleurotus eryngii TaxID=5323 RepID=A0A9P5ZIT9_PLEER|nr:hypothetical protein BDN71DRAFT_546782 [Pleurotus eryngii]
MILHKLEQTPTTLPYNGVWPMGNRDTKLADAAGKLKFYRFVEVNQYVAKGHKLFRSSAPAYENDDKDQEMTEERARFLKQTGIDCLISFNHVQYNVAQQGILKAAGITYL